MSEEDKTNWESIRIDRFIDDGEGLIIIYPPEQETPSENQD